MKPFIGIDQSHKYCKLGYLRSQFKIVDILDFERSQIDAKEFKCGSVDRLIKCYKPVDNPKDPSIYLFAMADNYPYDSIPVFPLTNRKDKLNPTKCELEDAERYMNPCVMK